MATSPNQMQPDAAKSSKRNEILIAIIGLMGVLTTAGLSNWDKVFPPENVVKSTFSGYQPTGDPQIELRYLYEITGVREYVKQMQMGLLDHLRKQAEYEFGINPELATKLFKMLEEELAGQYDELMNIYVPIASKYFSLAEVQELNKFYSTPVMRELTRKQPLINKEYFTESGQYMSKFEERLNRRIKEFLESEERKEQNEQTPPR